MSAPPLPYRVVHRRPENADTVTLVLEPVAEPLPPFRPGQFAMLYAFGVGEIRLGQWHPLIGHRLAHTGRAVGAVSGHRVRRSPANQSACAARSAPDGNSAAPTAGMS
ncbi:ferredoxin reductase domain-containing protein [Actinacidiphila soli]|uniref:hypothetical protein n=1 Tax=Actinacidiphila soli TaxID=2487275 RepID=UPI000FCC2864|nr:hypothetical protein [Actinacidiphila soli]